MPLWAAQWTHSTAAFNHCHLPLMFCVLWCWELDYIPMLVHRSGGSHSSNLALFSASGKGQRVKSKVAKSLLFELLLIPWFFLFFSQLLGPYICEQNPKAMNLYLHTWNTQGFKLHAKTSTVKVLTILSIPKASWFPLTQVFIISTLTQKFPT